jgi:hypothetical protein
MSGGSEQIGGAKVTLEVAGEKQFSAAMANAKHEAASLGQGSRGLGSALSAEARGWESVAIRRSAVRGSFALLNGSMENTAANLAQVLAISSPVAGAFGAMAVLLAASFVPAIRDAIGGSETFDETLKKVKKSAEGAAESVKEFSARRQEAIRIQELGERGDFGQINEQHQKLVKQVEQSRKDLADLQRLNQDNLHAGAAKTVPQHFGPGHFDLMKQGLSSAFWTGFGIPNAYNSEEAKKTNYFDIAGFRRELGRREARARGVGNPDNMTPAEINRLHPGSDPLLDKMFLGMSKQEAVLQSLGKGVMDKKGWSPRSVDLPTLFKYMSAEEKAGLMESSGSEDIIKQHKLLKDAQRNLAELNKKEIPALDERLLSEANPREYKRFEIRRNAEQDRKFYRDRGLKEDDPRMQLVDKIMQRQLDLVDKGGAGIVNVADLHNAIQGQILKDDASRTAIATEGTFKQADLIRRGIDKLVAHPERVGQFAP